MYQEAKSDDWLNRLQSQDSNEREEMMQGTNFELVGDFMEAFGQDVETQPTWPDFNTRELRVDLIQEEVDELVEAIANKDMVEIADALTDILYVVYGAGHTFGIDLDECFTEVHASNMSKLGEDGTPVKAENGKVMKGQLLRPRFREYSKPVRDFWKQFGFTSFLKEQQGSTISKSGYLLELACIKIITMIGIALGILSIFLYLRNALHLYVI